MKPARAVATLVLTAVVALPMGYASPAQAATWAVKDTAGDAGGAERLDIIGVTGDNAERRIVTRVRFAARVAGKVIVSVDPRGAKGVRLIAVRRRDGSLRSYVLPGAFTDRGGLGHGQTCPGADLSVRWRATAVRIAMPSTCLHDGDYAAVRFAVLTENGADSDYAPQTRQGIGSSRWVPRD